MDQKIRHIETELAIIGTGLAGISASVFALNRGLSCCLVGNTGALAYTTGYLDLLGLVDTQFLKNPWEGLRNLSENNTKHPLATVDTDLIRSAFEEFTSFISDLGIGYTSPQEMNIQAITPAGTIKPTLCVPKTMAKGGEAFNNKESCTIFGFHGLKGFSANQIVANLKNSWPGIQAKIVAFPDHPEGELYAEVAARSLEVPRNRELLAEILKKEAGEVSCLGLPAILGMHNPDEVLAELEKLCGCSIFEIPTMPPSVPGIRLREIVEQTLPAKGMNLIPQQKVKEIHFEDDAIYLHLTDNYGPIEIKAQSALLATGRFLSGGLEAHFDRVVETLVDLPVHQPTSRQDWYREQYLDPQGHKIHLAGIETDELRRPLAKNGKIFDQRLFGAGIVLAHQDWIRQRCGAGVAIATACEAVNGAAKLLRK